MDIEKEIRKILWGKSIVTAKNQNGEENTYILKSLSMREQNELDFLYEKSLQEALSSNVLSNEDLELCYLNSGIWTEEDEKDILEVKKAIKKLHSQKPKSLINKTRLKVVEKKIKKQEEKLAKMEQVKTGLFALSAEKYAEEIMNRYMVYMSVVDENDSPIWANKDEFLDCTDSDLIFNLTIKYIDNHCLTERELRKIARSGAWRYRWAASKNGESLFGMPISEWSHLHNNLVYWSQYYDCVYENPERPDDSVIEDDVALDLWFKDQNKKNRKNLGPSRKAKNGEFLEEFVFVQDRDPESIKEIYDQNTESSKEIIKETRKKIKEQGRVSEWDAKKQFRGKRL